MGFPSMTRFRSNAVALSPVDQEAARAVEAERTVLGGLMMGGADAWVKVRGLVSAGDFSRADHRLIFAAAAAVAEEHGAADSVLVLIKLGATLEAAGGREYIAQLIEETPSAAVIDAHARIVRDYANRGKVADITERIAAKARLGLAAADAIEEAQQQLRSVDLGQQARPLDLTPTAAWAARPRPAPREWVLEGLIPAGKVTSLLGNGGLGKTLAAIQIGLHVAVGRPLFDLAVSGGLVLGVFCEDDEDELDRRLRDACAAEGVDLADTDRLIYRSREGQDSVLCTFERDHL